MQKRDLNFEWETRTRVSAALIKVLQSSMPARLAVCIGRHTTCTPKSYGNGAQIAICWCQVRRSREVGRDSRLDKGKQSASTMTRKASPAKREYQGCSGALSE